MGVGPNYGLDKGLRATGATAYAAGEIGKMTVGSGVYAAIANDVARATTATTNAAASEVLVVIMEDLDAVRLATGKAFIDCRLYGIARVQCGATVAALDHVTNDATARAITVAKAAAGAVPIQCLGIALTGGTVGQHIDVLVIPGMVF